MVSPGKRKAGWMLVMMAATMIGTAIAVGPLNAGAVEVGERAPDFTLPSTNDVDLSLRDFRGKKWVFLEFYAAAYVPT